MNGQPAWLIRETTQREAGAANVLSEWSGFLAQDLSLIRGETIHRSPSANRTHTYVRTRDRIETVQEQHAASDLVGGRLEGAVPVRLKGPRIAGALRDVAREVRQAGRCPGLDLVLGSSGIKNVEDGGHVEGVGERDDPVAPDP